jgi:hypothetical protein
MANWPTQGQVKDEARALDRMIYATERMESALERLKQSPSKNSLDAAVLAREIFEMRGTKRLAMARSDEDNWIDPLEPADWRDEEWCVQKSQVSKMLAIFMGSFPTSNIKQPQIFTMQLLEDVMEREPSYAVLESTCRELRTTLKFMPSIAEFVGELDKQAKQWSEREGAHWLAIETYDELVAQIPATETRLATEQAEREKQRLAAEEKKRADDELRAQPLKVGDRVRHKSSYHLGPGTIVGIWSDRFAEVAYDGGRAYSDPISDLERMIPGDWGYEIPAGKRAEVEKRLAEYRVLLQRQRRPVVGDRVTDDLDDWTDPEDPSNGAGTVVFAADFEPGAYDGGFTIQFDNGVLGMNFMACQLRRLLPDDPEFERSEKVVAGWRAWELKQVDVEAGEKSAATTAGACQANSVPDRDPPDLHDAASDAATSE